MANFRWLTISLLVIMPLYCKAFGSNKTLTVNMSNNSRINITIPCGGRDPPYTYIHSRSAVVAENVNEHYTATNQHQSNNGETYCCTTIGGTTCYQLNITYPPYIDYSKYTGIPQAAILGEPYDIECPYESNPPAHYEWSRVPSCGTAREPLSWPTDTILFNNNQSLRLDGVQPFHYGYYNCSATNALGIGWFCLWRKVDVCSQEEYSPPEVEIQNHHPNITVGLYDRVIINCTVRSIVEKGNVKWKFNNSIINPSDNFGVISNNYDPMFCGYTSTVIINNFTRAYEGLYTCNASQPNSISSSDSIHVLIENIEIAGTRPKESSIMPLSIGLGGAVILFVITVAVSVAILIKSRKNILSQKVDTQHYTKPLLSDDQQFKYDLLPIYAEKDRDFVEKNFLVPLDKSGYAILNHHLNFIPGNPIADNILIAIKESRYLMPVITENFLKSKYCVYELEQSVIRMIKTKSTCIIPVTADIKILPECLKSLLTSVILEDKYSGYASHVDRIKANIGLPIRSK